MLIMTTGLPRPISFFLSILTVFMIAGWFVIRFHAERFQTRVSVSHVCDIVRLIENNNLYVVVGHGRHFVGRQRQPNNDCN